MADLKAIGPIAFNVAAPQQQQCASSGSCTMQNAITTRAVLCLAILLATFGHARALTINPIFSGTWTGTQQAVINTAIDAWENVIADSASFSITFDFTHAGDDYLASWNVAYSYPIGTDAYPWTSGVLHTIHFNLDEPGLWWGTGTVPTNNWDALSVTLHELGHAMGFADDVYYDPSSNDKWTSHIVGNTFDPGGLNITLASSENITHLLDSGATAGDLMVPALLNGTRRGISPTDLDMLYAAYDYAVPLYWTGAGSGSWIVGGANWRVHSGETEGYVAGSNVTFDDSAAGTLSVNIAANVAPCSVLFNNSTKNYTLTGTKGIVGATGLRKQGDAKVTIVTTNSYTGLTTVEAGTLQLNGTGARNPVLNLGGADIQGGKIVFDYNGVSSPATTIKNLLTTSYHAGSATHFDTGKFKSTTADADYGLGWIDNTAAKQVTVAYTLYGDATLSGSVDISDLSVLGQNWNGTGKVWAQGDFNYDAAVDISDLAVLGQHWNQNMAGYDGAFVVPEPGTSAMLIAGLLSLAAYAWRKRNGSPLTVGGKAD